MAILTGLTALLLICSVAAHADRPVLSGAEEILVSPSNFFTVHWTTTGNDSTDLSFAESAAAAADSCFAIQCGMMGFYQPPPDAGEGGDNSYDIYLLELAAGVRGYTSSEGEYKPPDSTHSSSASYICLSTGLTERDQLERTTASLFAGAVGVSYDYQEAVAFTCGFQAWMEDACFPASNLYTEYLEAINPLENPWRSFGTFGNAGFCEFHMCAGLFGTASIRNLWEYCAETPGANSFQALNSILADNGTSFQEFFMTYGLWRWFTGPNWFEECGLYGPDAALWLPGPLVLPEHEVTAIPFQGGSTPEEAPEENGLNWISVDLSSCQGEWIEFQFDGEDNMEWSLGVILHDLQGDFLFNWYPCQIPSGEKTVAIESTGWDQAVFFPACFSQGTPGSSFSFTVSSQGQGTGETEGEECFLEPLENPVAGSFQVQFFLPELQNAELILYDLGGRVTATLARGIFPGGSNTVEIHGLDLPGGIYSLILHSGSSTVSVPLVVMNP